MALKRRNSVRPAANECHNLVTIADRTQRYSTVKAVRKALANSEFDLFVSIEKCL